MPTTTRKRAKGLTREEIDKELAAAIADEEASTKAQAQAHQRRIALEGRKKEAEEAEKIRALVEQDIHTSKGEERLRKDAYADLAWERMGREGRCGECDRRGSECYRVSINPKDRLSSPSAKTFRIGGMLYSTCQDCKAYRTGCELVGTQGSPEHGGSANRKRKHESETPPIIKEETHPEEKRLKILNSDHRSTVLPTPSPEFTEGSSTRPFDPQMKFTRSTGRPYANNSIGKKLEAVEGGLTVTTTNRRFEEMDRRFDRVEKQIDAQKDLLVAIAGYMRDWGADVGGQTGHPKLDEDDELEYTDGE